MNLKDFIPAETHGEIRYLSPDGRFAAIHKLNYTIEFIVKEGYIWMRNNRYKEKLIDKAEWSKYKKL